MDEQETVDRLAELAQPRLAALLRLRGSRHVHDSTPGLFHSKVNVEGLEVTLNRTKLSLQPYRNIERFLPEDRVMQFIVDPGLLPLVTAMSKDILGRKLLVTRRLAAKEPAQGVEAHIDGFGVRIGLYFDQAAGDTIVAWECLYGVV